MQCWAGTALLAGYSCGVSTCHVCHVAVAVNLTYFINVVRHSSISLAAPYTNLRHQLCDDQIRRICLLLQRQSSWHDRQQNNYLHFRCSSLRPNSTKVDSCMFQPLVHLQLRCRITLALKAHAVMCVCKASWRCAASWCYATSAPFICC